MHFMLVDVEIVKTTVCKSSMPCGFVFGPSDVSSIAKRSSPGSAFQSPLIMYGVLAAIQEINCSSS